MREEEECEEQLSACVSEARSVVARFLPAGKRSESTLGCLAVWPCVIVVVLAMAVAILIGADSEGVRSEPDAISRVTIDSAGGWVVLS